MERTYDHLHNNDYGYNSTQDDASYYLSKETYQTRQLIDVIYSSEYKNRPRLVIFSSFFFPFF